MELAREIVKQIVPYEPGKPIEEVAREYGVKDIIKLASNENPLGASPLALQAIRNNLDQIFYYPESSAYYLRKALAEKYALPMEYILTGNGTAEIVEIITEAFLSPGMAAITGRQAFFKYRIAIQIMEGQIIDVEMPGLRYSIEDILQKMQQPEVKLIFIANPNNPTGLMMNKGDVERVLDALKPYQILVLDEAYYEYVRTPDYPDSLEYVKDGKNVIVMRTFSKVYGLAGLRIGYAMAPPEIIQAMYRVKEAFNTNLLGQKAALAALEDEEHLKRSFQLNQQVKSEMYRFFQKYEIQYYPSETNFILIDIQRDSMPIFQELLKQGVIVRPLLGYGLKTHLRVSLGLPEQMERFKRAFLEVMKL